MSHIALSFLPKGWEKLDSDGKHSTVANFEGGYRRKADGAEILVWAGPSRLYGVDEDGNIITDLDSTENADQFEIKEGVIFEAAPDDHTVDDDYTHLVEWHPPTDNPENTESKLCEGLSEASNTIENIINKKRLS